MLPAMSSLPRVAVLMGGPSFEHDVSLNSGRQVLNALRDQAFEVRIEKSGQWVIAGEPAQTIGAAIDRLRDKADVVFIALHGPFGEDGTVQGLLEACRLPYTGSGPAASGLAMDKARAKRIYQSHGMPIEPSVSISPLDDLEAKLVEAAELGFPSVVKPACNGSSFGVSFPKNREELDRSVARLIAGRDEVLVERFVRGKELTCGVLTIDAESRTFALPITEIVPASKYEFFDYEAKYTPGATEEITPARISEQIASEVQRLALIAHRALGCRDFSRSDFMLGDRGPIILETNTIPGLTATSLLPQAAAVAGIDFERLVRILIDNALRRS
jgi:D-alanine-D-alanine ligase